MRTETRVINGIPVTVALPEGNDSWKGSVVSIPELRSIPHHLCNDLDTYSIDGIGIFTYHSDSYEAESDSVLIPFDAPDSIGRWKLQDAYGSGGGNPNLPDPVGKNGEVLFSDGTTYVLRKFKASDIQPDFAATFNCAVGVVEVGATVSTPSFTSSYNDTPTAARFKDSDNSIWTDILPPTTTSFSSPYTFTKNFSGAVSFTLEVTGPDATISRSVSIAWRARRYWGVGNGNDAAFISGLSNSDLQSGRGISFTVSAGPGQLISYAFPSGQGTPVFSVGGFVGGFHLAASNVAVTNVFGVVTAYDLYQSDNVDLGTTTVVVS